MKNNKKIIILGMDGATLDLIEPWVKEGKLPTFKKVMEEGSWGSLKSVIPPYTTPAWQCFLTGKNPGKIGIFDFQKKQFKGITSSFDLPETIFDFTENKKLKSISINVPGTYPPPKINGTIISGLLSPKREPVSNPPETAKKLKKMFPDCNRNPFAGIQPANKLLKSDFAWKNAALYLMGEEDFDFSILVLQSPDISHHKHWSSEKEKLEAYQGMDKILKEFLDKFGKRSNIFVISDHGGGPVKKIFHINTWLEKEGYIKFKRKEIKKENKNLFSKLNITEESLYSVLNKFHLIGLAKKVHRIFKFEKLPKTNKKIDWKKSKVYSFLSSGPVIGLNINLRDDGGIVDKKDYDSLRDELILKLKKIRDPKIGEAVFDKIHKKEDIYKGNLENAPDLILMSKDLKWQVIRSSYGDKIISEPTVRKGKGIHRMNGTFMAYGQDIRKGKKIKGAELIDITPTLLHMFNIPIPKDMDGKVLKEVFRENSELNHDIIYEQEKDTIKNKISDLRI